MRKSDLFLSSLQRLQQNLKILADKPDESARNTLEALWCTASGTPLSAAAAAGVVDLPPLNAEQEVELQRLIDRRLTGVPLAHITGRQQFMGIELLAGPEALIPRKETELLAGKARELLQHPGLNNQQPLVIDLCTGAGNIAITLALAHPQARVFAADISPQAIELTNKNISLHRVTDRVFTRTGDLLAPFDEAQFPGAVDLITCNPPYISSTRVGAMETEIADHEPSEAFNGGPFGITIINRLIQDAVQFLRPGGWLLFEIGLGQGEAMVKRMAKKGAYAQVVPITDQNDHIRVIMAQATITALT